MVIAPDADMYVSAEGEKEKWGSLIFTETTVREAAI